MSGDASDDPELLVSPELFDGYSAPPEFEYTRYDDGEEEAEEEKTCQV